MTNLPADEMVNVARHAAMTYRPTPEPLEGPQVSISFGQMRAALEAALSHQGEVEGWRPIDTAPEGVICIVGWIEDDGDQSVFDIQDEGCWQEHENLRDHFLSVAPPESRGPKEKAPYTHWMPLPPVPTSDLTALISKAEKAP